MTTPLRVLILEDDTADAELVVHELRRAGFAPDWCRVETEANYIAHLDPALGEKRLRDEKRSAEEALLNSEKHFRALIEKSQDAIALLNADGIISYVSPSAARIHGHSEDETVGSSAFQWLYPEDARAVRSKFRQFLENPGASVTTQARIRHKDGTDRWIESTGTNLLADSSVGAIVVNFRDISERKRAEEETERRAVQFAALHETPRALILRQDLRALLRVIAERAAAMLQAAGGGIYLYDEEKRDLHIHAVKGSFNPPVGARLPMGAGMAGRVAQTRQFMIVDDYRSWEHHWPPYAALPLTAVVEVPMLYGAELVGVLFVSEFEPTTRKFTEADAQLLELLAGQAAGVVHDATMFQQVRSGRERLQVLSRRLIQAQEAERRHIARELHDEIGQILTTVKTNLQALQLSSGALASSAELADSMLTIDRALAQVRNLSLDLRPSILDDFGLVPALQWYLGRQRAGFSAELVADPSAARLPPDLETICFRVAQEALTNIIRYARAKRVVVKIEQKDREVVLAISDDGVGFDMEAARRRALKGHSIGLLGMQERVLLAGGQIDIESSPSHGTRICARFPLSSQRLLERRQNRRRVP